MIAITRAKIRIDSAKHNKIVSEKIEVKSFIKDKIEARKEMKGMVVNRVWEMVIHSL